MDYYYVKSNYDDNGLYKISIDDINYLALFATTLKPLPEVTEFGGYAAALEDYYLQNSDSYSESYHKLISSSEGKTLLCIVIQLELLQKQFKKSGLDEINLQLYMKYIKEYQHQIELNQSMFTEYSEKDSINRKQCTYRKI